MSMCIALLVPARLPGSSPFCNRVAALGDGWLDLDRPVPLAVGGSSGWTGSLHRYAATVQEGGVEKLTVQIEAPPRYGAHASDRGYNAIYLSSASHIWVQQVRAWCQLPGEDSCHKWERWMPGDGGVGR